MTYILYTFFMPNSLKLLRGAQRAKQSLFILLFFTLNSFGPLPAAQGQLASPSGGEFVLPAPGTVVALSPAYNPPLLKGLKVHPDNPFRFDFILDKGDSNLQHISPPQAFGGGPQQEQLKQESTKLIKYFLASLTIPEKDLWVNLSPYEKNRIIPDAFGRTEMGRDLLAEDYMLKQITSSLIYPEGETGKKFWKKVYAQAAKRFGTTNIPVNTFNKVWIVPEKAVVYENAKAGTAYVVESKLKVMLEEDYLSQAKHGDVGVLQNGDCPVNIVSQGTVPILRGSNIHMLGSQMIREIVIPELTKEVNTGANFAQLRQVYNSLILATWYKKKIKDSILTAVYANKNKIQGITITTPGVVEVIYKRYLQAFKKGVYNFIKDEQDPVTHQPIPRKYFSGGVQLNDAPIDYAMNVPNEDGVHEVIASVEVTTASPITAPNPITSRAKGNKAMNSEDVPRPQQEARVSAALLQKWIADQGTSRLYPEEFKSGLNKIADYVRDHGRISQSDFEAALEEAAIEFNKIVPAGKRYVVVFDRRKAGSSRWVFELARAHLDQQPVMGIYAENPNAYAQAIKQGIDTFVFFDDAIYSGAQMRGKTMDLRRTYHDLGLPTPTMIGVIPYHDKQGLERQQLLGDMFDVLISPHAFVTGEDQLSNQEIHALWTLRLPAYTLNFFDHKVADPFSFPESLVPAIEIGESPYKNEGTAYARQEEAEYQEFLDNGYVEFSSRAMIAMDPQGINHAIQTAQEALAKIGFEKIPPFALRTVSQQYYKRDPHNPFGANPQYHGQLFMVGINPRLFFGLKAWDQNITTPQGLSRVRPQLTSEFFEYVYNTFMNIRSYGDDSEAHDMSNLDKTPVYNIFRGFDFANENQDGESDVEKVDFRYPNKQLHKEWTKRYWYSKNSVSVSKVQAEHEVFSVQLLPDEFRTLMGTAARYIETEIKPAAQQAGLLWDERVNTPDLIRKYTAYYLYAKFITQLLADTEKITAPSNLGRTKKESDPAMPSIMAHQPPQGPTGIISQVKTAWDKKLDESRPLWHNDPRFPILYNAKAPIAYDPFLLERRKIGPYEWHLQSPPESDGAITREGIKQGKPFMTFMHEIPNKLITDPRNPNFVVTPNRWPKVPYTSLLITQEWSPHLLTKEEMDVQYSWAQHGAILEFHQLDNFVNHSHAHMYLPDTVPIQKSASHFKSIDTAFDIGIGEIEGYPFPHLGLTSADEGHLMKGVLAAINFMDSRHMLYYEVMLKNPADNQIMVLFFPNKRLVRIGSSVSGLIRSRYPVPTEEQINTEIRERFFSRTELAQLRQEFIREWRTSGDFNAAMTASAANPINPIGEVHLTYHPGDWQFVDDASGTRIAWTDGYYVYEKLVGLVKQLPLNAVSLEILEMFNRQVAHEEMLAYTIRELLKNAARAVQESGKTQGHVKIAAFIEHGSFVLDMSDDGIGLQAADPDKSLAEIKELIFEDGFSSKGAEDLEEALMNNNAGQGLYRIRFDLPHIFGKGAEIMALDNEKDLQQDNGGTTFRITIPLREAAMERNGTWIQLEASAQTQGLGPALEALAQIIGRVTLARSYENSREKLFDTLQIIKDDPKLVGFMSALCGKNIYTAKHIKEALVYFPLLLIDALKDVQDEPELSSQILEHLNDNGLFDIGKWTRDTGRAIPAIIADIEVPSEANAFKGFVNFLQAVQVPTGRPGNIVVTDPLHLIPPEEAYSLDEFRTLPASRLPAMTFKFSASNTYRSFFPDITLPIYPLKSDVPKPKDIRELYTLRSHMGVALNRKIVLAVSFGQEDVLKLVEIHQYLPKSERTLLIIAPDKILNQEEIENLIEEIQKQGLTVGVRTEADKKGLPFDGKAQGRPMNDFDIVLLNTQGEASEMAYAVDLGSMPPDRNAGDFNNRGVGALMLRGDMPNNGDLIRFFESSGALRLADKDDFIEAYVQAVKESRILARKARDASIEFKSNVVSSAHFWMSLALGKVLYDHVPPNQAQTSRQPDTAMNSPETTLAQLIRQEMQDKGWDMTRAANEIGVTRGTLEKYRNGYIPVPEMVCKIAIKLGMDVDAFFASANLKFAQPQTVKEALRQARIKRGLTYKEAADLLGMPISTLKSVEGPTYRVNLRIITLMIKGYAISGKEKEKIEQLDLLEQYPADFKRYLRAQLQALADWPGSAPIIRVLAHAALAQDAKENDQIDQLALLLHAQSWLSPSYDNSLFRSRGLYQNYQTRRMYERYGMTAPEIEGALASRLSGFGTDSSNMLFRNSNYALYALLTYLLPRGTSNIYMSTDIGQEEQQLIRQMARYRRRVVSTSLPDRIGTLARDSILILSDSQMRSSENTYKIIGLAPVADQIHVIYLAKDKLKIDDNLSRFPSIRLYGLYGFDQELGWNEADAGGALLEMNFYDRNLLYKLGQTRPLGGLVDSLTFWHSLLKMRMRLPDIDLDLKGAEVQVARDSFGDPVLAVSRMKARYENLLKQWEGIVPAEPMREWHRQGLGHLWADIKQLEAMAHEPDFLPQVFWDIEQDYHALLRLTGNLSYASHRQEADRQEALERRLEGQLSAIHPTTALAQDTVIFQSAMGAFQNVLTYLLASDHDAKFLVGHNVYYEIEQVLKDVDRRKVTRVDENNIDDIIKAVASGEYTALFIDPVANAIHDAGLAPQKSDYPVFDIRTMIRRLSQLAYQGPFCLVMDTSVLGPSFDLNEYTKDLKIPDYLRIVQVTSLQKFYEQGQELSAGGAVTVSSSPLFGGYQAVAAGLRKMRTSTGSGLGLRQLELLNTLGIDRDFVLQRTRHIQDNARALGDFLNNEIQRYPRQSIKLVMPGSTFTPDTFDYRYRFPGSASGPFVFLSVGDAGQNEAFDSLVRHKMAEKGIINFARNSFGFEHFSSFAYYAGKIFRYCPGEEDERQMRLIESAFGEALQETFASRAMITSTTPGVAEVVGRRFLLGTGVAWAVAGCSAPFSNLGGRQKTGNMKIIGTFYPQRKNIVFIHGLESNPDISLPLLKYLDQRYNVFFYQYARRNDFDDLSRDFLDSLIGLKNKFSIDTKNLKIMTYSFGATILRKAILLDKGPELKGIAVIQSAPVLGGVSWLDWQSDFMNGVSFAIMYGFTPIGSLRNALRPGSDLQEELLGEPAQARYDSIVRKTYTIEAGNDKFRIESAAKNVHYQRGIGADVVTEQAARHENITWLGQYYGQIGWRFIQDVLLYDDGILPVGEIPRNIVDDLLEKVEIEAVHLYDLNKLGYRLKDPDVPFRSDHPIENYYLRLLNPYKRQGEDFYKDYIYGIRGLIGISLKPPRRDGHIVLPKPIHIVPDHAMVVHHTGVTSTTPGVAEVHDTGGIDLTSAQVKTQGGGIQFQLDAAQMARFRNASGFVPVIISIRPMTNLRQFLGLSR